MGRRVEGAGTELPPSGGCARRVAGQDAQADGRIRGGITGERGGQVDEPLARRHPIGVYVVHATVPRGLGIEPTRLTFRHNGIDRRLTDVHGHVIEELLV